MGWALYGASVEAVVAVGKGVIKIASGMEHDELQTLKSLWYYINPYSSSMICRDGKESSSGGFS